MKLHHPELDITIHRIKKGKRRLTLRAKKEGVYVHQASCDTAYSDQLLQLIIDTKGGYACDEIARDEDSTYVAAHLHATLHSYLPPSAFQGKRLLDFGSGSGASTMILARLLPHTELVGVELEEDLLRIARARAQFYGKKITFLKSPSGTALPKNLGTFDIIMLSAVFEHLLPEERLNILSQLWQHLKKDGIVFIDETPHRWFPIETHTTGLPLINYLPRPLAQAFVRISKRRGLEHDSWKELLRKGIRGGSVHEIRRTIQRAGGQCELLKPTNPGAKNPIDVWKEGYIRHSGSRANRMKRLVTVFIHLLYRCTHIALPPYLSLAIRKKG